MSPLWLKPRGNPHSPSVFMETARGLVATVGEFAELGAVVEALFKDVSTGSASSGGPRTSARSKR